MIVALVLGAAVRPDGTPSATLRLRVAHAVQLFKTGRVQMICVAGGKGDHGPPEGEVGIALARDMGVPASALLAELQSRSTVENLQRARPLLPPEAQVVLVSNRWHLPRAGMAAWLMRLPAQSSGPRGQMSWGRTLNAIAREVLATPATAVRAIRSGRHNGR